MSGEQAGGLAAVLGGPVEPFSRGGRPSYVEIARRAWPWTLGDR